MYTLHQCASPKDACLKSGWKSVKIYVLGLDKDNGVLIRHNSIRIQSSRSPLITKMSLLYSKQNVLQTTDVDTEDRPCHSSGG
jgi:hypothetical protein